MIRSPISNPGKRLPKTGSAANLRARSPQSSSRAPGGETFKDYTDLELYTVAGEDSYWIWCRPNFLEAGSTFDSKTPKIQMSKSTGQVEQLYTSW